MITKFYFMETNDLLIWEKVRTGDVDSLRILHDRFYYTLYSYADNYLKDSFVAEELVSSCFIKLWMCRKNIIIEKSVKSYLFLMLRNRIIDEIRKPLGKIILQSDSLPEIPDETIINKHDFYAELYLAIRKLPEKRRDILELAVFDGLTYKEIANKLGITVNTVKTQISRAYQFLKENLDPQNFIFFCLRLKNI